MTSVGVAFPIMENGFQPFQIHTVGDKVVIDTTIWGWPLPPVEIVNNNFKVRPTNWDRNSNENALEVVDENSKPRLQVIRVNLSHYRIEGIFPLPSGGAYLAGNGITYRLGAGEPIPPSFQLAPIFKYPGWKYPGKYADGSN